MWVRSPGLIQIGQIAALRRKFWTLRRVTGQVHMNKCAAERRGCLLSLQPLRRADAELSFKVKDRAGL